MFRALPSSVTDGCGRGVLIGARIVADEDPQRVRSVVYGVTGETTRRAVLETATGSRALTLGPGGSFLTVLRGFPEDQALAVTLTDDRGKSETRVLGRRPGLVPDLDGAPAWRLERFEDGTRQACARLSDARMTEGSVAVPAGEEFERPGSSLPTACLDPRESDVQVVADLRRFTSGQQGVPGFDRWHYRDRPPRTILWGLARTPETLAALVLGDGSGDPRAVPVAADGSFAVGLPADTDRAALRLRARLRDGAEVAVVPGQNLSPDSVPARRAP